MVLKQRSRNFIGIKNVYTPSKVKFTISGIESKITKHVKKVENMTYNKEGKNQSIKTNLELTLMQKLVSKNRKTVIICIPYIQKLSKKKIF